MALSKQVKKQAYKQIAKISQYKTVFESPDGRAVLADLMAYHGVLSAHPVDPQKMAIKEGERAVVLRILQFLKEDPAKLKQRIEEHERSLD